MKKYFTMALAGLMLCASTICFAASGKVLDAEEAIAEQYAQGGFYKKVSPFMSADMQKNFPEAEYIKMQTEMASALGQFTTFKMRNFTRYDEVDVLTYQLVTEKVPVAQYKFVFKLQGEKPFLDDAFIELPAPKEEKQ